MEEKLKPPLKPEDWVYERIQSTFPSLLNRINSQQEAKIIVEPGQEDQEPLADKKTILEFITASLFKRNSNSTGHYDTIKRISAYDLTQVKRNIPDLLAAIELTTMRWTTYPCSLEVRKKFTELNGEFSSKFPLQTKN